MKKHLMYAALAATVLSTSVKAQDNSAKAPDNATTEEFKPSGKLWGYTFGDLSFKQNADSANRNSNNNQYSGMPKNMSTFEFRRIYLGYDYQISPKISTQFLLAQESLSEVQNGSNGIAASQIQLGSDNKRVMYIKLANVKIADVLPNHDLVVGQAETPSFPMLTEKIWGYRSIERTVLDLHRGGSNDLGVMLKGHYMDGNLGYNLMIANGSGAVPEGNVFKKFYGDVYYWLLDKKVVLDFYADYERFGLYGSSSYATGNTTAAIGSTVPAATPLTFETSRSTYKAFIAYTTPKLTIGVEGYIQNLQNAVMYANSSETTTSAKNAEVAALSLYVHGTIIENKLRAFANYQLYNPMTNYSSIDATNKNNMAVQKDKNNNPISGTGILSQVNGYNVNNTETFVTAGLDYMPHKNVHFMPNVWYTKYSDRNPNLSSNSRLTGNSDIVYRMTFYYVFGK